jgi:hypothetical protein
MWFQCFHGGGSYFDGLIARLIVSRWPGHCLRHNSTLQILSMFDNPISAPVRKSLESELVLCQLRNAHVTKIDAPNKGFDDADAIRIAEALRCEILGTV